MVQAYFEEIKDRRAQWKIKHNMTEVIVMTICAVAGGCDSWEMIEDFCKVKEDWFREEMNLQLKNGIPYHDTFERIFGMIEPQEFERHFIEWTQAICAKSEGEIDHIRMRKDHSAENMAIVRHIVLNILKSFPTPKKLSLSRKRQKCEYDFDFLKQFLFLLPIFMREQWLSS